MGKKEVIKKEDLIQAVVVTDSFNSGFAPLTSSEPSCLLPLAGRPLLEYTLQCLSYSGVQDVILYLTNNSSKVKEWLSNSEWGENYPASPFLVTCITNEDCRSFGDAMRDLYEKGVIRNDFILCSGDLVSNIDLLSFLASHKETVKKDKKSIMTAVYTQGYQGHPLRSKGSELVLATDKLTNQILFYQRSNTKSTNFPIELFQHNEVDVLFDTLDANIYMCSPAVLGLFSDNFDIQDMDTMVNEILESELVDSTIYLQIADSGFACRSNTPYLYGQVINKVLSRWAHPFVPERRKFLMEEASEAGQICLKPNSIYKSTSASVSKGSVIGKMSFIGNSVALKENCLIENSSLEQSVTVGKNTKISGSVVMKNTSIGDKCVLNNCIVGQNVQIPDNCRISDKVIIGQNVVLNPNSELPTGVRISCEKPSDGFSDDEENQETKEEVSGEYGPKAFVHEDEDSDDEDFEQEASKDMWGEIFCTSDESSDESEDESDADFVSDTDLQPDQFDDDGEHDDVKNFKREVTESLQRAVHEDKIVTDNLVLEINSSKHAWNTTLCEVNQCVLESVLTLNIDCDTGPAKLLANVKANIVKFKGLLLKYSKSKSGQEYYLTTFNEFVKRFPTFVQIIHKVLHLLYDMDVLGEDSILAWAAKIQDSVIRSKIQPFLDWLEEDEDEESSDED